MKGTLAPGAVCCLLRWLVRATLRGISVRVFLLLAFSLARCLSVCLKVFESGFGLASVPSRTASDGDSFSLVLVPSLLSASYLLSLRSTLPSFLTLSSLSFSSSGACRACRSDCPAALNTRQDSVAAPSDSFPFFCESRLLHFARRALDSVAGFLLSPWLSKLPRRSFASYHIYAATSSGGVLHRPS